jgi:SET domain-containing protein
LLNQFISMTKAQLLQELANNTWCMIKPSPLHGIGVFAIRDIPKGCNTLFSTGVGQWITVPKKEVETLPQHSQDLIENYCLYDEDNYFIADYGFKVMDLVNFLNHSDTPNIASQNEGETFVALRDIACGEELLVDYGAIVDG